MQAAHAAGFTFITTNNYLNTDMTFIIDNAHTSYGDDDLWCGPLTYQHNRRFGSRYCLFVAYGSPTDGPDHPSPDDTPSRVTIPQTVSITESRFEESPQISLFFNREEFDDVLQRKRNDHQHPVPLHFDAADYLFNLTNGQPGAVIAVLDMIHKVYKMMVVFEAYSVLIRCLAGISIRPPTWGI
jgi:hypothetical protein